MSSLIYKRYLGHQWTAAWDQLPQAEREAWLAKLDAALRAAGGKRLIVIDCEAGYALEHWDSFGFEVFPDMAAADDFAVRLEALQAAQYVDMDTAISTDFGALGLEACFPDHE